MAKTALVVSGGGSKGAFAVGAIEVLREQGIEFDIVTGSSTGALIAPLVATDEIPLLRHIYTSVRTDDIIRARGAVIDVLSAGSIYDSGPLWTLIDSYIDEARFQQLVNSPVQVEICTTNLQSGQAEYFNPRTSGPGGTATSRLLFNRAVLASASQPVLMPAVAIHGAGGDQYVDGGLREMAPIRRAIDKGATRLYAIVLGPEKDPRVEREYAAMIDTLLRSLDVLLGEVTAGDVADAQFYNRALGYLARVRRKLAAHLSAEQIAQAFEDGSAASNPFAGRRRLHMKVIRPESALPSDSLSFSPLVMSRMMALGAKAARRALGLT